MWYFKEHNPQIPLKSCNGIWNLDMIVMIHLYTIYQYILYILHTSSNYWIGKETMQNQVLLY